MEKNQEKIIAEYLRELKEDEISLKLLFHKLGEYLSFLVKKGFWIILVAIIGAAIFAYKANNTLPVYNAELTFMVNEEEGGSSSGVAGIIGQFIGGGSGEYNFQKILELSRTRHIIKNVILERVEIGGSQDYLANHIINYYSLHEVWEENQMGLNGFLYSRSSLDSFGIVENLALKILTEKIAGNEDDGTEGLLTSSYDEQTSILNFNVKSINEELSIAIVDGVYEKLSKFYVDKAIERQMQTFQIISNKVDSLRGELTEKQYRLLRFTDAKRNLSLSTATSEKLQLQRDIQLLTYAFGKASENRELADFSLRNATPYFQTIDGPLMPISPVTPNMYINGVIGFICGLVIISLVFVVFKVYNDYKSRKATNA